MPEFIVPQLPGAAACLLHAEAVDALEVEEDQDEEIDSMLAAGDLDDQQCRNSHYLRKPDTSHKNKEIKKDKLEKHLEQASAHIVVESTLMEYRRLWKQFTEFCSHLGYVKTSKEVNELFPDLPSDFPTWIAIWIMDKADELDIHTGKSKDPSATRVGYATAQKLRAAISHKFRRDYKLGTQPWMESHSTPGSFTGNPSLSVVVSQYMISLRRRKVRAGETVTSARALNQDIMKRLWEYNKSFPDIAFGPMSRKRKAAHPEQWAGKKVRQMLQLLYITSMLCLLRYDEALRIMWPDMTFEQCDGEPCVRLELPFRKTAQNGRIAPFVLFPNYDRPWMCPVQAFSAWVEICDHMNIAPEGYVFRKRNGLDAVSLLSTDALSNDGFLECFRNNMVDIHVDPRPYGTHSFRRGGCQYLHMVLRWPIRTICSWGGWAENFDNPGTLFKYLLSWTDTPLLERKDFFNPNRAASDPCNTCGRTCHCA